MLARPTTLSAAVSLVFSKYAHAQWTPNVEVYGKPGNKRTYTGVDAVVPVWQDGRSLAFGDLKFKLGTADSQEFNLGAGYRRYLEGKEEWAYGLYGAWDRRRAPSTGKEFDQLTLGAELRSAVWDFRGNYYAPQTKKQLVCLGTSQFAGFGVFRNGVFEEAMRGYDLEAGARLPIDILGGELRAYVAGYSFKGQDIAPKTNGTRVRLEYSPRQDWILGLSAQHDGLFGNAVFLEVRYSFGKPPVTAQKTLRDRMIDPWVRDIDVAISPVIESPDLRFAQLVQGAGVVNVDSSKPAGGDGSAERPYNSIAACVKCAIPTYNIVRLWQGTSATTPYTSVVLLPNQTLWGQGVDIFTNVASPGLRPVISSAGDTITLTGGGNNFTVAGVDARSTGGRGVYGANVGGTIAIRNSNIQGYSGGIHLLDTNGSGSRSSNITIANNQISATYNGNGIWIRNSANGSGTRQQTVTISGNTINVNHSNYGRGIYVTTYAGNGTSTQAITISGNTISRGGSGYGHGVKVTDYASSGSSTQTVTVSGNTITSGGTGGSSFGLFIGNETYSNGGRATQTVSVSGNTISASGNSSRGVYLRNYARYSGTANQTSTLSGNTISASGNSSRGVYLRNYARYSGTVNQTSTLSGNTISASGNFSQGVYLRNYARYTSTANQTSMLSGNTISASGKYGVLLRNDSRYSSTANQTTALSGNTISSSGKYGVSLRNYARNYGTATQNSMLSGNTISATGSNAQGLRIYAGTYTGGTAVQSVVLTGSTVNAPGGTGIFMTTYNNGGLTQSVTLSGNTINATTKVNNTGIGTCTGGGVAGCP